MAMRPIIEEIFTEYSPEKLVELLGGEPGVVLLRSALFDSPQAQYSFVAANPFLSFRSFGSRCEIRTVSENSRSGLEHVQFGDPWRLLDSLIARYELLDEVDLPFPLGGCFGYWGYDLKNFVEPKLARRCLNDLELPDCHVGFYDNLVVFDHRAGKVWSVSTGLGPDGIRSETRAHERTSIWKHRLTGNHPVPNRSFGHARDHDLPAGKGEVSSDVTRAEFLTAVQRAKDYIRAGDIYQVNLSQRLSTLYKGSGWQLFQRLSAVSPAPFSAYLDCQEFEIASSSPELFLRMSGSHILTRPIKGTRPRSPDRTRDAQLSYELQTSTKEMAELVMITDLLRNDLGRVCEFGSLHVPELVRLERYPQVQHLVSTVEGRLRKNVTHFDAFAACFPGGSITGAPKFRAMEIIEELEPHARGPYTGAIGYLGFNRESQLSITIRTAVCKQGRAYFQVGAGIVTDSNPAAEYDETMAKASGFFEALKPDTLPKSGTFSGKYGTRSND
jgi:para-aminobenzoate synthetase component 1